MPPTAQPPPPIPLVGLRNLGNTCYAAAVLNALVRTQPLTAHLVECQAYYLAGSESAAATGSTTTTTPPPRLVRALLDFITDQLALHDERQQDVQHDDVQRGNACESPPVHTCSPYGIMRTVQTLFPDQFEAYRQHDAAEFLRSVLARLHEEMEAQIRASHVVPSGLIRETTTSRTTIVHELFEGMLQSHVKCSECGKDYYRDEAFYDLPVQIDNIHAGSSNSSNSTRTSRIAKRNSVAVAPLATSPSTSTLAATATWAASWASSLGDWIGAPFRATRIYQCLDSFFRTELLAGAEQYQCDNCGKLTDGEKTLYIKRLPEILTIQLKRFRYSYFSSKIRSHVDFPQDHLDMGDYLSLEQGGVGRETLYDLYCIVQHSGTMLGGHYIAYIRMPDTVTNNNDTWYELDDDTITKRTWEHVAQVEAYLLFYRKKQPPARLRATAKVDVRDGAGRGRGGSAGGDETRVVSKLWLQRFRYTSQPGPLTLRELTCPHGAIDGVTFPEYRQLLLHVQKELVSKWARQFGSEESGQLRTIDACVTCAQLAAALEDRRKRESEAVTRLDSVKIADDEWWYLVDATWLTSWNAFRSGSAPPGPISNERLLDAENKPRPNLVRGKHYRGVNARVWKYLKHIYNGGPTIARKTIDLYGDAPATSTLDDEDEDSSLTMASKFASLAAAAADKMSSSESISRDAFNDRTD